MFDYPTEARRCQTENAFNQLHIDLEGRLSPLEIVGIAKLAQSEALPRQSHAWLDSIKTLNPDIFEAPQRYRSRALAEGVMLYEDPDRVASEKDVLVAFTGNAARLMLPAAVFLQFLDSRRWDVLLLKKGRRKSYRLGVDGVAADLSDLVRYIEAAVPAGRYRRRVTLGTSGGGHAAIVAAILMGASRGVSIGGSPPTDLADFEAWRPPAISPPPAAAQAPDLYFAFGSANAVDRRSAVALQEAFGGRLRPVAEVSDHNVLHQLLKRRELAEFLNEVLVTGNSLGRWRRLLHRWLP